MSRLLLHAPARAARRVVALWLLAAVAAGSVSASPAVAQDPQQPPAQPTGLSATTATDSPEAGLDWDEVALDWDDIDGATGYLLRWRLHGPDQELNDGQRPTTSDATITVDGAGAWVARVQACNNAGCSGPTALRFDVDAPPDTEPTTTPTTTTAPTTTTTTTTAPTTTTTTTTTTTVPAPEPLSVTITPNAVTVPVGEAATLSAGISNAPSGTPAYLWEMSYGGGSWFTLSSEATASYLSSSPETVSFRVTVTYGSGESAASDPLAVTFAKPEPTPQTPARPTGLEATTAAGLLGARLDWDDVDGATYYWVRWRVASRGTELNDGVKPTLSNEFITVTGTGAWMARVQACNDAGCGAAAAARFEVVPLPPEPPANFQTAAAHGSLDVDASWDEVDGAASYKLRWWPEGDELEDAETTDTAGTSATVTVADFGSWHFQLEACNDGGCGFPRINSLEIVDLPQPQEMFTKFVSNTEQTEADDLTVGTSGADHWTVGLAFTTGNNRIALSEVDVSFGSVGTASTIVTVSVRSTDSAGLPTTGSGSTSYTLTNPDTITANSVNTFTAPANSTLEANTTYIVTFTEGFAGAANAYNLKGTDSNSEDDGATTGWSIADTHASQPGSASWANRTARKPLIAIKGTIIDTTFVSNTGQTRGGSLIVGLFGSQQISRSLAFTTGSDAVTLSQVDVTVSNASSATGIQVSIWSTTASGSGHVPASKLYTLTSPTTWTVGTPATFTAPASSTLNAGTTYAVVFEAAASQQHSTERTDSDNEDDGATTGWSIADFAASKSGSGNWSLATTNHAKPPIAIKGTVSEEDTTAPTLSRATAIGTALTLVYDEPLDTGSVPANTDFSVTVAGAARTVSTVVVRGPLVLLVSSNAYTPGETVTVSYTVPTGAAAKPIRDAAENNAAALTNQAVTVGVTLVANTAQTASASSIGVGESINAQWSQAVAFTTGPNAGTLFQVDAEIESVLTGAVAKGSVWSATSAGLPDTKLYDLVAPVSLVAGTRPFFAPANSTLAANTTYVVVFQNTTTGSTKRYFLSGTVSREEDTTSSQGFSIADRRAVRSGTGAWSHIGNPIAPIPKIAVKGTAPDTTPPELQSLTVARNTLTLTYDEPLDDGSTPAPAAFTPSVGGTNRSITSGSIAVSGSTVTLSMSGAAVTPSQAVSLSYTVPSANPIQDEAGNDAAAVSLFRAKHIVGASNTGQTAHTEFLFVGNNTTVHLSQSLAFTTGNSALTLSRVDALLGDVPAGAGVQVSIWSTTATGLPASKLYTLANPATITANSVNIFTAPANSTLDANTTYAVVFENTATSAPNSYRLATTNLNGEDSGTTSGWSIANNRATRSGTNNWTLNSGASKPRIAIKALDTGPPALTSATLEGTKLTLLYSEPLDSGSVPPKTNFGVTVAGTSRAIDTIGVSGSTVTLTLSSAARATQPVTVNYRVPSINPIQDGSGNKAAGMSNRAVTVLVTAVANTGQTAVGDTAVGTAGAHAWSQALAFTTGPNQSRVTAVEASLKAVPATAGVHVSIWDATAAGLPNMRRGVLTNPATITANSVNTFTAPGSGLGLLPNRTYLVVFQNTETGAANTYRLATTSSNAEDSGAEPGWSIADLGAHRSTEDNTWKANGDSNKVQFAIKGNVVDTTSPTLSRATVEGTTLRLVYNEALDTGSTPANSAFAVTAPGTNPTVTGVSVNGASVVLTLSAAVTAGPVTVSYTAPSTNPVQDWAGHDAANLTNRAVTLQVELVANTDPARNSVVAFNRDFAQAFTTGSSAEGYVLTEVGLDFSHAGTTDPPHTVTIQGATPGSGPDGTVLATLTNPGSITTGVQTYTASGTGIALAADTTYFVVLDSRETTMVFGIGLLTADAEDSGAAPGWSIADAAFARAWDSTGAWTANTSGNSAQIAVHGRANDTAPPTLSRATVEGTELTLHFNEAMADDPAPAITTFSVTVAGEVRAVNSVAVSGAEVTLTLSGADVAVGQVVKVGYVVPVIVVPLQDQAGNDAAHFSQRTATHLVTMVANTGQTADFPGGSHIGELSGSIASLALAFTTGASAVTLSEVQASLAAAESGADVQVSVWSTTGANNLPDSKLYDLTNPGAITANALNTFTAPANSTLDAGTTYAVLFENGASGDANIYRVVLTDSNAEDTGAATGWTIADKGASRVGSAGWNANTLARKAQIAIRATTGPTLTGAVVSGRTLTLTYDKTLDTGSTPANNAFTVTVAGAARNVTRVVVNGSTVTLTLSGASVIGGQTVTLSYVAPAANPIQDSTGNDAADLTNQAVTVHGITAVAFTSQPTGNYASIGGHVEITLSFSENATVTGTPRVRLSGFTGQTRHANYHSGTGTKKLVFRYTLADGDSSGTTNVSVPANGLQLNGGTIRFGTANAPAGHISLDSGKTAKVAAPSIELAFAAPTVDADQDGTNETHKLGDGISVRVRFTEPVSISGGATTDYQIVVTIGSTDHTLTLVGGSGTANLLFGPHTVVAADSDTDGIVVKRDGSGNLVRLSGAATIRSTANGNDAVLTAAADLGVRADPDHATPLVLVRGTNALPTGANFTVTTNKDVDLAFALTDFAITDADGDALKEIQVVTLPDSAHGTLELDGTAIPAGDLPKTVTRAELSDGDLTFSPVAEFISSDTAVPTFTFKVVDPFGDADATARTATIRVVPGPPLATAVATGRTLALVYERDMDTRSVPPASAFAVKVDGSAVNVTRVTVRDKTVTLTLARSVSAANVVTVSYTKGTITNPLQDTSGFDASDLVDEPVSTAPLTVTDAVISRDGTTATIRLSEENLQGSFNRGHWRLRLDGRTTRTPSGGSFDPAKGIVTLTFPSSSPVTWTDTLMLSYHSSTLRNHANNRLAQFSGRSSMEVTRFEPENAACTMGPGPDPWNPDGPCGTGTQDPTTAPRAYRSIDSPAFTESEMDDPPEPQWVRVDCPSRGSLSCTITFKGWKATDTYWGSKDGEVKTYQVRNHIYKTLVWAELKQDPDSSATCETERQLKQTYQNRNHGHVDETTREVSQGSRSFSTPTSLPSGCAFKEWVVAVHIERAADKVSGAATVYFGRLIIGSSIADTLTGDAGRNLIVGRGGNDTLTGNDGIDTFGFMPPDHGLVNSNDSDTITDYHLGATKAVSDIIHICRGTAEDAPTWSGADSGSDHVITVRQGSETLAVITLQGITTASANFANLNVVIDNSHSHCG